MDPTGLIGGGGPKAEDIMLGLNYPDEAYAQPELTQEQAEFVIGFYPPAGLALSARDFEEDPSLWTGGILILSAFGLRGPATGLRVGVRGSSAFRLSISQTKDATRASKCLLGKIATRRQVTRAPSLGRLASFATGADHITWGADVLKLEALEEFLHGTMVRLGKDLGSIDPKEILKVERYVKGFLVRHQRMLGLSDADVVVIGETLLTYEKKYGGLKPTP